MKTLIETNFIAENENEKKKNEANKLNKKQIKKYRKKHNKTKQIQSN